MKSLLAAIPEELSNEVSATLFAGSSFRVERIVSLGHCSPAEFWYDQAEYEWVALLKGRARIRFEDEGDPIEMAPGDYLTIAPHRKHRVEWTTPDEPTVWLAIHYSVRENETARPTDEPDR